MKLILASGSLARRNMLEAAGLEFDVIPADIDEASILDTLQQENAAPEIIAKELAQKKALDVSSQNQSSLVVGGDQILEIDGQILSKASDKNAALSKLKMLRGKTHHLISAVAVSRGDELLWGHTEKASLTMHECEDAFLEDYAEKAGQALTRSVGAYELEAQGSWLFEKIEGDYFTILGMPLLPLLTYLRTQQGIGL